MRGRAAMAAAAGLLASTTALAQTPAPAPTPAASPAADPLRAVIFAGEDAVIDLGPIVPTPAAPASAAPPQGAQASPAAARFTVTRVSADGARETRAIDVAELQTLGRLPPPPVAPVAERRPVHARSSPAPPLAATTLPGRKPWPVQSRQAVAAADDGSDAADAVSPLLVQTRGARQKTKVDARALVGVRDGRGYGGKGRLYVYAGMKNRGVGLNVVDHGDRWGGDGVSYDQGGFAGQRSAGVGWRQGEVSTSLGWVHDKTRINGLYGAPAERDDRVALTLSWRPAPR